MTTTPSIPTAPSIPAPTVPSVTAPRGLSVASFVLGMISLAFGFVFVVPVIGAVLGFMGLRTEPAGRGFALAGIWINLLITGFWLLVGTAFALAVAGGVLSIPFWV